MLSFSKETLMRHHRPSHQGDSFSLRHPKMPPEKRAKLFLAFDALRGFDVALDIAREFSTNDADSIEHCDKDPDFFEHLSPKNENRIGPDPRATKGESNT